MRKQEKDSMNWLMNQSDAKGLVKLINPREFTVIEAVVLRRGSFKKEIVLESNTSMVQDEYPTKKVLKWMDYINKEYSHEPGEKYIYFRFTRTN